MEQGGGSVGDRLLEKDLESPQQDEDPPLERKNPSLASQVWRWLAQFFVAILNPPPQPPVQPPVGGVQDNHDIDIPVDPPEGNGGNGENQTVGNEGLCVAIKRALRRAIERALGRAIEPLLLGIAITASILNVLSFVLPGAFLKNAMKLSQTYPIWICSVGNDIVWLILLSIRLEQSIRLQQGNIGVLVLHELQHAAFLFHYSYMIVQLPVPPVLVAAGTVLMRLVCMGAHLVYEHYGVNAERQIRVASGVAIATSAVSSLGPAAWFRFLFHTPPKLNLALLILGMAVNLLWGIICFVNFIRDDEDWRMLAANCAASLCAFFLLRYT